MNRYKHLIGKRLDTKRSRKRYNSNLPPLIKKLDSDLYIIARDGDRLDMLAYEYYNDQSQWWVIAQANHLGKGTLAIKPGIRIRIPSVREYYSMIQKQESER